MTQQRNQSNSAQATGSGSDPIITEFISDIRRRARAVECLLNPRRPDWTFDSENLPADDVERLIAIKREVERVFDSVFIAAPRSRNAGAKMGKVCRMPRA